MMPEDRLLEVRFAESKHFTLRSLTRGVYACIHKPGGAGFSNAGIIDLGDHTLVVDTFHTRAAGRDLRQTAEALFGRPVETAVLTHAHHDHWMGACAFDASTTLWASEATRQSCLEWAPKILEDFQDPALWEEWLKGTEQQLQTEQDPRLRGDLEHNRSFIRYIMAERTEFQPRTPDQIYEGTLTFQGSERQAELRSLGRGHSEEDSVLLLPQDGIAFTGDIGFFDTQPLLSVCDLDLLRPQMRFFAESDFQTLVPGHGPVGGKDALVLQLKYWDVLEDLVRRVAQGGGSFQEALQITLPEPFDQWLMGGMGLFEGNVRTLFKRAGGEVPEEK
jgi:cyclase